MILSPPAPLPSTFPTKSIFLGGTIDMGKSVNWQTNLINKVQDHAELILNPRRLQWDSSWGQDSPELKEQVLWELDAQERASVIVYYFAANSRSPITLLELGIFKEKNVLVFCHPEFYRRGNVKITCQRFFIPYFHIESEWEKAILESLNDF